MASRPRSRRDQPRPARWRAAVPALLIVAVVSGGLWWVMAPPSPPARPAHPDVLLITLDAARADRLGSYGYAAAMTPNLDRLAAAGARFTEALTPVPLTLPAHATLMTGRRPAAHGLRVDGRGTLDPALPTLAARFGAAGYDTAAFVSAFALDRQFGLARGFSHYDDALDPPAGPASSLERERRGDRTVQAATAWLRERRSSRPWFLWLHLNDAHGPYTPPMAYRGPFEHRLYDGELAFVDALVGEVLAAARPASGDPPLVVVAGDHGEGLGDHGESTHGLRLYQSTLRVPLLVAWTGVIAPRVVDVPVGLADVAPTVAALVALPPLEGADGASLVPWLDGGSGAPRTSAAAETLFPSLVLGWTPLRMLRQGPWKYIDAPTPELYDLSTDPGELTNLATARPDTVRTMREGLARAAGEPPATSVTAGDPVALAPLFEQLLDGERALQRGDVDRAVGLGYAVLAADPGNGLALLTLGRGLLLAGRHREALDALRLAQQSTPSADAHHWTALAHLRLGDRDAALAADVAALALDPRHGGAITLRAGLLFSAGRRDEGVAALREAVSRDPLDATLRVALADLLAEANRPGEAEPEYRRVLEARPNDVAARLGLGLLLARDNRLEPALAALTRVLELAPGEDEARFERGVVYERLGRTAEARMAYERLADPATRPDIRQAAAARLSRLRR